jgi:hypothetical protein
MPLSTSLPLRRTTRVSFSAHPHFFLKPQTVIRV